MATWEEQQSLTVPWYDQPMADPGSGTKRDLVTQTPVYDPATWGGVGGVYDPLRDMYLPGTPVADRDVARYQAMGAERRPAVALDQRDADAARAMQLGSLAALRAAAEGQAPSRAAILGRQNIANAMRAGAQTAGARGPGAAVAAHRAASAGAGGVAAQQAGSSIGERVGEVDADRAAYVSGAQSIRGQDIGAATTDAELEMRQRALEAQRQQYYEQLAWNTKNAVIGARLGRTAAEQAAANANRAQGLEESQRAWETQKTGMSTAIGGVAGGVNAYQRYQASQPQPQDPTSDVRAKYITSDENAKRKAFSDGLNYAQSVQDGKAPKLPNYAQSDEPSRTRKAAATSVARPSGEAQYAARVGAENERFYDIASNVPVPLVQGPMAASRAIYRALPEQGPEVRQPTSFQRGEPTHIASALPASTVGIGEAQLPYAPSDGAPRYTPSDERTKTKTDEASMAAANRSMAASAYEYKPEYLPPEQKPGEVNIGPMAQNMARDPVARTAVVRRPDGMLALDTDKSLKVTMGGLAALQRQVDAMKRGKK